ncbi:glycosyl hydrolase [Bombiscardovia apis]|uniref:Glycosyl hydrolase n=1 Tax=Bombiscardovia apis TaxID=2932182 RepID=A0ABM8BAH7_9BIFI|nr:glycoside hydrolase family 3 C-terminal domain-containing protein [Bombiscardovia apis]BDR53906.1 glycosyl hydrolase [Bombiscardovia apis]
MKIKDLTLLERASLLSGRSMWDSRGIERAGIHSFVLSDGPHGLRRQMGSGDNLGIGESKPATCFPTAGTVACSWDPELAESMGRALGEEARSLGVNVVLGPGMNIKRNPLCGRNFEYYSEDPQVAGHMAAGLIRGIQSQGVAATPKHFAMNSQELRRQASNSVVDERTLRELYLTGFEIAVRQARPWALMTSYNMVNGTYANENKHLLQDILRDEWGFDGMVVSDWGGSNSAIAAAANGSSLEMPEAGFDSMRQLVAAVQSGELAESDLNARAEEVAKLAKLTYDPHMNREGLLSKEQQRKHHDVARHIAEGSAVLLRNENNCLPLAAGSKVALVGDMAKTPRFQGSGSSKVNATQEESLLELMQSEHNTGLELAAYAQGYDRHGERNQALIDEAVQASSGADIIVACLGLDERSESEGLDRSTMDIPQAQTDLLTALHKTGKPIVVVLVAGSPVSTDWIDNCESLLYIGLAGQASASATLNLLTGKVNPSGHLAETWPIAYDDCPSSDAYPETERDVVYKEGPFVGYRYYLSADVPERFPFGFGLSYTHFTYSNMSADRQGVTLNVTNDSDKPGATVVQIYVSAPEGGVLRPVRELKGFTKVALDAHETRQVQVSFDQYTFRHWDTDSNAWQCESGEWTVMVGSDARRIELSAPVEIEGSVEPKPAEPALGHYLQAQVKEVNEEELNALFGYPVVRQGKLDSFGPNDPISSWKDSKSGLARFVASFLTKRETKQEAKTGSPDLNTLFVLNMPPRAMAKMTNGMISTQMVDAIVRIPNGHAWKGIGGFIAGFFRNSSANRRTRKELNHE